MLYYGEYFSYFFFLGSIKKSVSLYNEMGGSVPDGLSVNA